MIMTTASSGRSALWRGPSPPLLISSGRADVAPVLDRSHGTLKKDTRRRRRASETAGGEAFDAGSPGCKAPAGGGVPRPSAGAAVGRLKARGGPRNTPRQPTPRARASPAWESGRFGVHERERHAGPAPAGPAPRLTLQPRHVCKALVLVTGGSKAEDRKDSRRLEHASPKGIRTCAANSEAARYYHWARLHRGVWPRLAPRARRRRRGSGWPCHAARLACGAGPPPLPRVTPAGRARGPPAGGRRGALPGARAAAPLVGPATPLP